MTTDNIIELLPAARRHHEKQLAELLSRTPKAEPKSFIYLGNGLVFVSLASDTGEIAYIMTAGTFMKSINTAVALMNENLSDFLSERAGLGAAR